MESDPSAPITQPETPNKWKITAIIFIVLSILLVGLSTFLVVDKLSSKNDEKDQPDTSQENGNQTNTEENEEISNIFTIPEWNIQFTIPDTITDIRYVIASNEHSDGNDNAYLVARPSDNSLQYPSDISARIKDEALAILTRSTSSTQIKLDITVEGKRIGNYYFYTAWSFSGLATGAGVPTLFGETQNQITAASTVFHELNDMLRTIRATN